MVNAGNVVLLVRNTNVVGFQIFKTDTLQMLGIILGDIKAVQRDHLVADHPEGFVGAECTRRAFMPRLAR